MGLAAAPKFEGWLEDAPHALSSISCLAINTFFNVPNPVWPSLSLFRLFILFGLHNKQPALAFFRFPRLWFMVMPLAQAELPNQETQAPTDGT